MNAEKLAGALDGGRQSGPRWLARCPAHDDRTPSLSICDGADGKLLVHYFAGCRQSDVLAALKRLGLWDAYGPDRRRLAQEGCQGLVRQTDAEAFARALWLQAEDVCGTLGERYLNGLELDPDPDLAVALRFHPRCPFGGERGPALLAAFHPLGVSSDEAPTALAAKLAATADPLEVFIARAETGAYLMSQGELDLHYAVDVLQDAAVQTGLVGALGQDAVQAIMAKAFGAVHEPASDASFPDPVPETAPGIRAAASTVEALVFSLRQRGAAALAERACQSRLAELSTAQIRNVIERLIVARPRFPVIDDELLFLLSEQLA